MYIYVYMILTLFFTRRAVGWGDNGGLRPLYFCPDRDFTLYRQKIEIDFTHIW
jgi:hypothetical protein